MKINNIISLAELAHLRFEGNSLVVEVLMAGVAAPSLQELRVSLSHMTHVFQVDGFHIPHLTKFIRNVGMIFLAAQLQFSYTNCNLSLLTDSHSIDNPPFSVTGNGISSIARISSALSALLATIEDVFFAYGSLPTHTGFFQRAPWRDFFAQLPNVKILRVQHGIETEVANMLRQSIGQPTTPDLLPESDEEETDIDATVPSGFPVDSNQFNLGFLPSLEGIEIFMRTPDMPIPDSERVAALEPFEALFAARRQAGLAVKVYWNTDQVLPASFYDDANSWHRW